MRKFTVIIALVLTLGLSACGTEGDGGQAIPGCSEDGNYRAGCSITIDYKDKPLDCVTWGGSHGETGLTCDFVKYHARKQ